MKRKIIFLIVLFLLMMPEIYARSKTRCDYTLVSNYKKLSNNVDISYNYRLEGDRVYFDVTLTNLQPYIYFTDNYYNRTYYYSDTNNGIITIQNYDSGKISYSFYTNDSECLNEKLNIRYINLPYYNKYYNYEECKGIEEYSLCNKWIENKYGYNDFKDMTEKYRQQKEKKQFNEINSKEENWFDKIVAFYLKYFYIITPMFIGFILGIINLIKYIRFKTNRFNI